MNPEQRKNRRGGVRVQKSEGPRREKETKRGKGPGRPRTKKQRILLGLYIALTVVATIIVAGVTVLGLMSAPLEVTLLAPTLRHTTIISGQGEEVEMEIPGLSAGYKEQFYTFLVAGVNGGNTDTILLAAHDAPNQKLSIMSLPRNTYVIYNDRTVMIDLVYSRGDDEEGDVEALKKTVGSLTGVIPDFYVLVGWETMGELIGTIGDVYFNMSQRMYYNDLPQHFKIDLQPDHQFLGDNGAVGVLYWRHNNDGSGHVLNGGYAMGDLGHVKTQQAFLKEVARRYLQPDVPLGNLMDYISIFQKGVTIDLSMGNLACFDKSAIGRLDMDSAEFVTPPNQSAGGAHLLSAGSQIVKTVNGDLSPYRSDTSLRDLNLAGRRPGSSSADTTPGPQATPKPETTPSATSTPVESPPGTPPATSTPGGSQPPAISAPSGQMSPPVQTPAATLAFVTPSAESTPPPTENTPTMMPPPAVMSDGDYGPGMVPVE